MFLSNYQMKAVNMQEISVSLFFNNFYLHVSHLFLEVIIPHGRAKAAIGVKTEPDEFDVGMVFI